MSLRLEERLTLDAGLSQWNLPTLSALRTTPAPTSAVVQPQTRRLQPIAFVLAQIEYELHKQYTEPREELPPVPNDTTGRSRLNRFGLRVWKRMIRCNCNQL